MLVVVYTCMHVGHARVEFLIQELTHVRYCYTVEAEVRGQVENAEVRKSKYGNGSTETEVRK